MPENEPPSTLPSLLAQIVAARGEHPAIITAHETISYRELDRRSARLALGLLAAGAGKGTRIGLLAPDGILWVTAFLAALRIGSLVTTISTLSTPPELAHILRHSDCQFLIGVRRFLNHDYAATLAAALPELDGAATARLRLERAPYLRSIRLDDAEGLRWAQPISGLIAGADDELLLAAIEREVVPSDDALVVYTSGSTAQPKAVVHHQWAVARHPSELARMFVLKPDDRMMVLLPAFWLAGLSTILQVLSVGATLVIPETPGIEDALDLIERVGVTRVNAWGDKQPKLIEAARARGVDISRIPEFVGFRDEDGNTVPSKIAMFGMTESFSAHSAHPLNVALPEGKEAAFGRAIGDYERRIVDPETGREVAPGEVGELQIRGPALLAGLYKSERRNVFTPDGFYPTKDLARLDTEGWIYPAGRLSDMIKTKAANVSRLEVESALAALPGVDLPVVAGLPDPEAGEIVVAAIVQKTGVALTEDALRAALRGTLSSYKIPRRIVFVEHEDVPRTVTGKIKLVEVAQMIAGRLRS
jgi:acyl-CoA synthetase (AMP-forming)/AMP-acid ligase II